MDLHYITNFVELIGVVAQIIAGGCEKMHLYHLQSKANRMQKDAHGVRGKNKKYNLHLTSSTHYIKFGIVCALLVLAIVLEPV